MKADSLRPPVRSVAAVGDAASVHAWSGIPFHFWRAARAAGFAELPWRLDLSRFGWPRRFWTLERLLRGRRPGGFQYSDAFLDRACAQVPPELLASEVITFNQHFPPARAIAAAGGELNHYIDATFAAMTDGRALDLHLPPDIAARGRERERANYASSRRVVTMARWAARSVVEECGADAAKVATILPGANFDLPADAAPPEAPAPGRAGREREFVLGFVGMDWRRKGLPLIVDVRAELARRGWKVLVLAAGDAPERLTRRPGVRFVGRIDKAREPGAFLRFLLGCDVGCLFSGNEALGISTLEFLRAGVPVAGFAHQGLDDTLPPDAGFRFPPGAAAGEVADVFDAYLRDETRQAECRRCARAWSPLVTWERCVAEMRELWDTGAVRHPVRPWLGLEVGRPTLKRTIEAYVAGALEKNHPAGPAHDGADSAWSVPRGEAPHPPA